MLDLKNKKIFIFDVDGTIADSYCSVNKKDAEIICNLLVSGKIVVFATSRSRESVQEKVLNDLSCGSKYFSFVYILPAAGAAMYKWNNKEWEEVYRESMDANDIVKITEVYKRALHTIDPDIIKKVRPNIVNKKGVMLSCSALPVSATKEERRLWDPNHKKRIQIIKEIVREFPYISANIGGSATIDITKIGINKAYGLNRFFEILKLNKKDALFVGDGIFPGGNDYCVLETGIETMKVESPEDTATKLQMFLN